MATGTNRKKLLLLDRVEVRSLDVGFLGSWHPATVIGCGKLTRIIQYDHILNDEGSSRLTEKVNVSPAIEGCSGESAEIPDTYRGMLRPWPPISALDSCSLRYGQCVDFLYEDGWWEGVIFDKEDGSEQRRIFFPDMGDEMEGHVDKLRLTQDWDEVSEKWKPRGNWLFLNLFEEFQKGWPLPVSVKQIWYDVRTKTDFEKLCEWTSSGCDIWKDLVSQVLSDNFRIYFKQFFTELNSSLNNGEMGQNCFDFSETAFDSAFKSQWVDREIVPKCPLVQEQTDPGSFSMLDTNEKAVSAPGVLLLTHFHYQDEDLKVAVDNTTEASSAVAMVLTDVKSSKNRIKWHPFVSKFIPKSESFPEAIHECKEFLKINKKIPNDLTSTVRKHLFHLGWKIDFVKERGVQRYRYTSPDGKLFYSLTQICQLPNLVSPVREQTPQMPFRLNHGSKNRMTAVEESSLTVVAKSEPVIEPEYCPEAVKNWYHHSVNKTSGGHNMESRKRAMKAKKHLSALGWSFKYILKGDKREMRYISPNGIMFFSLRTACGWLIDADNLSSSNELPTISGAENVKAIENVHDSKSQNASAPPVVELEPSRNFSTVNNQSSNESTPKGVIIEGEVYRKRISRKRSKTDNEVHPIQDLTSSKRRRITRSSKEVGKDLSSEFSAPPSLKGNRLPSIIASTPRIAPRSISSLLVDKNVVPSGARVQYRAKNSVILKEGHIFREGIECSCCGEIYTLSKFEEHSGSTYHRPSANIFLEDGRSLADCQLQISKCGSTQRSKLPSHEVKQSLIEEENDCICSICHFGGELLLCDQCPSSFHTHCLGLKDVPGSNWYCPPCCCRICCQHTFDKNNRRIIDSSVLVCSQCERRYHADCLTRKGITNPGSRRAGEWFCQDSCEQIFSGLMKILGKPVPLVTENLTWTLLKYKKSTSSVPAASVDDRESCSKLNLALSVMHECFEPVKEHRTGRDLVDDIFNQRSELHRLNFQGFYTILLEMNDDLISVATVRIYGKKVAEVPLVATRFRFRRLGMCRILMNELEKQLMELGIERLVLPAVPSVLDTWTNSFGFNVMDATERSQFLDHTFLDFQGTVFCHKLLIKNSSITPPSSSLTRANLAVNHDEGNMGFEGSSTGSEESTRNAVVDDDNNTEHGKDNSHGQQSSSHDKRTESQRMVQFSEKKIGNISKDGIPKCYKRRRISAFLRCVQKINQSFFYIGNFDYDK